jgi:hypothetical protein
VLLIIVKIALIRSLRGAGADGLLARHILLDPTAVLTGMWTLKEQQDIVGNTISKCQIIGSIKPTGPLGRFIATLKLLAILRRIKKLYRFNNPTVIGGSLKMAVLLQVFFPHATKKLYLFSDITRFHMSPVFGPLVARLEGMLINQGWIPCVTSPGFYYGYLRSLRCTVDPYLLHNVACDVPLPNFEQHSDPKSHSAHPVICWAGLLRCNRSVNMLSFLAMSNFGVIVLAGKPGHLKTSGFNSLLGCPSVHFLGAYEAHQLAQIYGESRFTWACDWSSAEIPRHPDNSSLLLPNRLYQGIAFGIPIIASKDSWVGKVVTYYGIGIEIEINPAGALQRLKEVNARDYDRMVCRIRALRGREVFSTNPWDNLDEGKILKLSEIKDTVGIFGEPVGE